MRFTTARFDEDDFESAYRELDRRYYAGEGAAFAEAGICVHRSDRRHEQPRLRSAVQRAQRTGSARRKPHPVARFRTAPPTTCAPASANSTPWSPVVAHRGFLSCAGSHPAGRVSRLDRDAVGAGRRAVYMDAAIGDRHPRRPACFYLPVRTGRRGCGVRLRRGAGAGDHQPPPCQESRQRHHRRGGSSDP